VDDSEKGIVEITTGYKLCGNDETS